VGEAEMKVVGYVTRIRELENLYSVDVEGLGLLTRDNPEALGIKVGREYTFVVHTHYKAGKRPLLFLIGVEDGHLK
jgi:hypothetical protein